MSYHFAFHTVHDGKASVYNAGDQGSSPGLGRSPGEGNGSPLQYYCLENPMDRGAWQVTVYGVAKSWTRLSDFTSLWRSQGKNTEVVCHSLLQWTTFCQTLESPLDCKEIQPVHPKGDQSWMFIGRTDVEAETPILWPPDAKS